MTIAFCPRHRPTGAEHGAGVAVRQEQLHAVLALRPKHRHRQLRHRRQQVQETSCAAPARGRSATRQQSRSVRRPLLVVLSVPFHWSSCRSLSTGFSCQSLPFGLRARPILSRCHQSSLCQFSSGLHASPPLSSCQLLLPSCRSSSGLHASSLLIFITVLHFRSPCQSFSSGLHASYSLLVLMPVLLFCS